MIAASSSFIANPCFTGFPRRVAKLTPLPPILSIVKYCIHNMYGLTKQLLSLPNELQVLVMRHYGDIDWSLHRHALNIIMFYLLDRQLLDGYLIANPVLPLDPHCLVETGNWPAAEAFFDAFAFFVVHLLAGRCFAVECALLEQFVDPEPGVTRLIEPEMLQFWTTRHSPRRFDVIFNNSHLIRRLEVGTLDHLNVGAMDGIHCLRTSLKDIPSTLPVSLTSLHLDCHANYDLPQVVSLFGLLPNLKTCSLYFLVADLAVRPGEVPVVNDHIRSIAFGGLPDSNIAPHSLFDMLIVPNLEYFAWDSLAFIPIPSLDFGAFRALFRTGTGVLCPLKLILGQPDCLMKVHAPSRTLFIPSRVQSLDSDVDLAHVKEVFCFVDEYFVDISSLSHDPHSLWSQIDIPNLTSVHFVNSSVLNPCCVDEYAKALQPILPSTCVHFWEWPSFSSKTTREGILLHNGRWSLENVLLSS
ncbi:hypothetical protein CPB83DRAFT_900131 [Crepidotus variabilis]|uniref:Uncharacterized protein n=1 Tax=Crepidotus variabilis TaxID=179855 RepID=A0A9P6E3R0_9AGAR|nr:hypothetical protein CPB83DRAFT_900131 [Crepidotus variabilis]